MMRAYKSEMRLLRTIVAAAAVLGFMVVISLPFGSAQPGDDIEQKIREAKTPADHQALAAFYEKEAQTAQQLANKHLMMRQVYAAAHAMQQHDQAGENCAFVAKKYQEMAKEYETLATIQKMVAEQLK
jgi:hypothetical protein